MAIYVTSDAHGHVRALDEALSKISLTSDDTLYVLGDMIDRGPDPVGVIKLVRSLPNAHVLKGNHEQIMLDAIIGQDPLDAETWDINGGWTTREQLNDMEFEAYEELVRWMAALPLYAVVETEERPYLLVHAGIEMKAARAFLLEHGVDCADGVGAVGADRELLQQMLAVQSSDDLLWIRHGYWDASTAKYASAATLAKKGFKILNTNNKWYYVIGKESVTNWNDWNGYAYTCEYAKNQMAENDCLTIDGDSKQTTPVGCMAAIWCDYPNNNVNWTNVESYISTFRTSNPNYFKASATTPEKPGVQQPTENKTVSVTVGGTTTVTIDGKNLSADGQTYATENSGIATVTVSGQDAQPGNITYTN